MPRYKVTVPSGGKWYATEINVLEHKGRLRFPGAPSITKNAIKSQLTGAKWNGEQWSADVCPRNFFRIRAWGGANPRAPYRVPIEPQTYTRPLMSHQREICDAILARRHQIIAGEAGVGKTLAAQEAIERSGASRVWWVGVKSSLENMRREFAEWEYDGPPIEWMSYERLLSVVREGKYEAPDFIVGDEVTKVKNADSKRTIAFQRVADQVRPNGHIVLMSGTPAPKRPSNWWSLAEIACPGYLDEGSTKQLELTLATHRKADYGHGPIDVIVDWIDEEVERLADRLDGLVIVKFAKDCLDLPELTYETIKHEPTPELLRVAHAIKATAPSTIQGLTRLRELSDGFQYRDKVDGTKTCTHCEEGKVDEWFKGDAAYGNVDMFDPEYVATLETRRVDCPVCKGTTEAPRIVRETIEVPCPKEESLRGLLQSCEETGRVCVFAGFQGSVDRCERIARADGWSVVRVDGRGWRVTDCSGNVIDAKPLDYWNSDADRVAFVAHPESGGMSFTLTRARVIVVYSNSFKPEFREQLVKRIHRKGQTRGCKVYDLVHLPSDERVIEVLRENRRLEKLSLGEFLSA